ncbi:MAG: thioredoxin family protein [Panacagrimonas sp.]
MSLMRVFQSAGLAGVVALAATTAAQAAVEIGKPAPTFSVAADNGKTVNLADYSGKYVVLEWTNDGCPFVRKHYGTGNMQGLQKEFAAKGVTWLSVISSAPGKQGHVDAAGAKKLSESRGAAPTAVLLDESGSIGHAYETKTTPHMFVIDPKGNVIYAGGIDDTPSADSADIPSSKNFVKLALNESMAGKPVTTPLSKPYGCAVKY